MSIESIDWDSLTTFDDWSGALGRILVQARITLQSGDVPQRAAVQQQLADYIANSPNRIAAQLDVIARQSMDDLLNTAVSEALTSIASRSADLAMHAKTMGDIAASVDKQAGSIRLDRAREVVDATTGTIQSLTGLRQTLSDGADDKVVADKIDKAVKAIHDLVPLVMRVRA
jgi:hypothetical protein